jgi:hypothetical protein
MNFRNQILDHLVHALQETKGIIAVWEGGSAANKTTDQYSDLDLCILGDGSEEEIFSVVASTLESISPITHIWNEPKSIWPELTQKIYFLKDSPKHFFVDVGFFPKSAPQILAEFMQIERHGSPVVHFDRSGLVKARPVDKDYFSQKHRKRLSEIVAVFPIYRLEAMKELDRDHIVDAIVFYQQAMLKPLIEVMGMIYRPYQFDFGFRYIQRTFPKDVYVIIEDCVLDLNRDNLESKIKKVDQLFSEYVARVEAILELQ